MTARITRRSKMGTVPRKKYMVGGQGRLHAYADSLEEAKQAGHAIAKRELLRGSWNVSFVTVPILIADEPGSTVYRHTGWRMYVPVRGTGKWYKDIVARIKERHGVPPMAWTKN